MPTTAQVVVPILGSLLSGFLFKKYSKARGGDAHQLGSPAIAVVTSGLLAAITGDTSTIQDISLAGGVYGGLAIAAHSISKNGIQYIEKKIAQRVAKKQEASN